MTLAESPLSWVMPISWKTGKELTWQVTTLGLFMNQPVLLDEVVSSAKLMKLQENLSHPVLVENSFTFSDPFENGTHCAYLWTIVYAGIMLLSLLICHTKIHIVKKWNALNFLCLGITWSYNLTLKTILYAYFPKDFTA